MLKIFVVIISIAEIVWSVDFKTVCDNEIKPWVLYDKAPERPKPQFDAEDVKFYLYNKNNQGVLLEVGAATPSPSSTTKIGSSSSTSTTDASSSTSPTPSSSSTSTTESFSSTSTTDSSSTSTTDLTSSTTTTDSSSSISTTDLSSSTSTTDSSSSTSTTDSSSSTTTTPSPSSTITTDSSSSISTTDSSSSTSPTDSSSSTTTTLSPSSATTTPPPSTTTTTQKPVYDDSRKSGNNDNLNLIDKSLKTVFIVHGWFEHHEEQWISNLTQLLVSSSNVGVNVIALDYSKYSNDYFKASVQVVKDIAQAAANFLKITMDKDLIKIEDTYFIGFGLGAHVSGMVGRQIQELIPGKRLARITGLDPVGFLFNTQFADRLEISDANFVDVVQTNSDWLGSDGNFGQVTFRMNGGKRQPKCPKTRQNKVKKMFKKKECTYAYNLMRCSHLRSTEYWAESVLLNNFVHRKSGIVMGVNGNIGVSGEYIIKTRSKPPYGRGR